MKNAILPQMSSSSHLYDFGNYNEELGISNIDIPTQNLYESMDDVQLQNHHGSFGELCTIYSQSSINDISEILDCPPFDEESHSTSMPNCDQYDGDISQMPVHPFETLSVQRSGNAIKKARKRSIEANDHKKYKKAMCFQGAIEGEKILRQRVPLRSRRSQKLTDKITALQKLVSPYGKTDTASVLLEAYISIKLLQDQIQKLVCTPGGEKGADLQRRGLSLVPVSLITHKLVDSNFHINTSPSYS